MPILINKLKTIIFIFYFQNKLNIFQIDSHFKQILQIQFIKTHTKIKNKHFYISIIDIE